MSNKVNRKESKYVPTRLRKARIMNAYSMAELATFLGVTPQAISQYELGTSPLNDSVMIKASQVLNLPITYFEKPEVTLQDGTVGASFFRRRKTVSKKQQNAFIEKASLASEVFGFLCEYVDFPEVNIPDFSDDIHLYGEIDRNEMDIIVNKLKVYWGIPDGPIGNISDILQQNGFILSRIDNKNGKMDAFSNWVNARPHIYLSETKSTVRDRFDLAHELGHLILHMGYSEEDLSKSEVYALVEDQANAFASAFLLQSETFFKETITSSIDRLLVLKKKWMVSVSAMIRKIGDFEVLSQSQIDYLKRQMTERGMWRAEPFDDIAQFDAPDILRQAVDVAIHDGLSVGELVDSIGLYPSVIETICCLAKGKLSQNNKKTVMSKSGLRILTNE